MLVLGPIVADINASFERFWASPLSVPVGRLLESEARKLTPARIQAVYAELHAYAGNMENYAPEVREATQNLTQKFTKLTKEMAWSDAAFLCDLPGKNDRHFSLGGGGRTTSALMDLLRSARRRVTIQSPYLVLSPKGLDFFRALVRRGVEVRISTNSLAGWPWPCFRRRSLSAWSASCTSKPWRYSSRGDSHLGHVEDEAWKNGRNVMSAAQIVIFELQVIGGVNVKLLLSPRQSRGGSFDK